MPSNLNSVTVTDICNRALIQLGQAPITIISDSPQCEVMYPAARDFLLSAYRWTFATVRQELAELAATPLGDFDHVYRLPVEPPVLRILDINPTHTSRFRNGLLDYQWQRLLHTDVTDPAVQIPAIETTAEAPVVLSYIAQVGEAVFPQYFIDTLSLYVAIKIAETTSRQSRIRQQIGNDFQTQFETAKTVDSHQDSTRALAPSLRYIATRQRGRRGFDALGNPLVTP